MSPYVRQPSMEDKPSRPPEPSPSDNWRVLVVDGNSEDREGLARGLRLHGHDVSGVATGREALRSCAEAEIVLLDLDLPDLDGLDVCRNIRSASEVPLIAVTAWGSELDRVLGLQAGADDYVVEPYGFRELLARMEAVMRRTRFVGPTAKVVSHGDLTIDGCARKVSVEGRSVEVTRKEFDLLYLLARHPDTVVPRKQIMQQVWGDSWSRRTVDTHVSSLRGKLGNSEWIVTVRGVGFRIGKA